MKTINEILVEANLTEAQVDQVAGIVQEAVAADRAKLREAHTAEIAKIEESRSNVVTALMKDLSEANKKLEEANKKVCEGDDPELDADGNPIVDEAKKKKVSESDDTDADDAPGATEGEDDDADDLEEKAFKLAADALEEALTRIHPMLKQARAYGQLKQSMVTVQESFQRVFGDVAPLPAAPAAVVQESTVVDQSAEVERLRAEVFDLRCHEIFNSLTSDLAESTKIRVSQLVDMAHSSTLQEYTELVEVAISHNKIISEQSKPAPAAILEERKVDNSMAKYLKVLAK